MRPVRYMPDPTRNAPYKAKLNTLIGAEVTFGDNRSAGRPVLQELARRVQAEIAPRAARPCRHAR